MSSHPSHGRGFHVPLSMHRDGCLFIKIDMPGVRTCWSGRGTGAALTKIRLSCRCVVPPLRLRDPLSLVIVELLHIRLIRGSLARVGFGTADVSGYFYDKSRRTASRRLLLHVNRNNACIDGHHGYCLLDKCVHHPVYNAQCKLIRSFHIPLICPVHPS